jgi:hypothetical protein
MNRVPLARRVQVINCLVEGSSIRSTERMAATHRDTICRLRAGTPELARDPGNGSWGERAIVVAGRIG